MVGRRRGGGFLEGVEGRRDRIEPQSYKAVARQFGG